MGWARYFDVGGFIVRVYVVFVVGKFIVVGVRSFGLRIYGGSFNSGWGDRILDSWEVGLEVGIFGFLKGDRVEGSDFVSFEEG